MVQQNFKHNCPSLPSSCYPTELRLYESFPIVYQECILFFTSDVYYKKLATFLIRKDPEIRKMSDFFQLLCTYGM